MDKEIKKDVVVLYNTEKFTKERIIEMVCDLMTDDIEVINKHCYSEKYRVLEYHDVPSKENPNNTILYATVEPVWAKNEHPVTHLKFNDAGEEYMC